MCSLLRNTGFKFAPPTNNPTVGSLRGCLLTCSNDNWCNLGRIPGAWPNIMSESCEVWEAGTVVKAQAAIEQHLSDSRQSKNLLPAIWTNVVVWRGVCWPSVAARQMNQWLLRKLEADWAHIDENDRRGVQLGWVVADFVEPALARALIMSNAALFRSDPPAASD